MCVCVCAPAKSPSATENASRAEKCRKSTSCRERDQNIRPAVAQLADDERLDYACGGGNYGTGGGGLRFYLGKGLGSAWTQRLLTIQNYH